MAFGIVFEMRSLQTGVALSCWGSPLTFGRAAALVCLGVASISTAAFSQTLAQTKVAPRASIELFTSQGCSSCPPADKLIADLGRDPSLVTMSLAIDYWDYLGWKDTLALKGHGKRQQAYARVRGDREVYTPQVVINGVMHVAGSDKAAIERAIEQTQRDAGAMHVPVTLTVAGDKLTVEVPTAAPDGHEPAEVWLVPITKKVPVAIERGENRGHTLTYSNVVRRWVKLGEWTGKAETYNMSVKELQNGEIDSVAVIVQSGGLNSPGLMLGANTALLR
jgi:hypothetical protein